jgi:quercetin dioxygenase-like cupin family protein
MSSETRPVQPPHPPLVGNHSKVIRHVEGFQWQDVPIESYKETTEHWKGITRRELVGQRGESPQFHLRYFELAPGGYSTLEQHEHEHAVIVQRGRGEVQFGCYIYQVGFGDVIYVSPGDPHQFRNAEDATEPFGFMCIVNAERDRPQSVDGVGFCHICE